MSTNSNKRIAIPLLNGVLSLHFGKCNQFSIVEIADGEVIKEELYTPPEHTPGSFPNFIASKNATDLLVGGIGGKAIDILNKHNINVVKGVDAISRKELIEDYLSGKIKPGDNSCDGGC